jgi:fatty acid desaturase
MIKASTILSRGELWQLRQKTTHQGLWLVVHAWLVIAATMTAYAIWPSIWLLIIGVFIVGARQLGLAILMHDAAHGLLSPNLKLNDFVGNVFCAWPAGLTLPSYRPYHMKHHRFTQQTSDPDLILSKPFPISRPSLARKIIRDLTGITFLRLRFFQMKDAWGKGFISKMGGIIGLNILLWAILASFGFGHIYFLLWLLPLATSYQLVARIRNIAEHAVVPSNDDDFRNTRTTHANYFERIFIAPYWVNYHIEHHLFVFVPCYNLKSAHLMLKEKNLLPTMEIRNGYLDVLKLASTVK